MKYIFSMLQLCKLAGREWKKYNKSSWSWLNRLLYSHAKQIYCFTLGCSWQASTYCMPMQLHICCWLTRPKHIKGIFKIIFNVHFEIRCTHVHMEQLDALDMNGERGEINKWSYSAIPEGERLVLVMWRAGWICGRGSSQTVSPQLFLWPGLKT